MSEEDVLVVTCPVCGKVTQKSIFTYSEVRCQRCHRDLTAFADLGVGKYYVKEKETANGYVLDGETREVDLTYRDQNTAEVTYSADWQNKRQKAEVKVLKKAKDSDRVLEGAVFALCNKDDIVNARDVEYIEILFNSVEKCIAVRPCNKDNINAVKWGTIRNGKWAVLPKSCRGFSEPLFELMNWNDKCKYRFRGQYSKEDNEQILLFDLEEPEVIKHEMVQEDLPDANMTETEENTVDTSENRTKKIVRTLFPKQWRNHFGCSSEDVVLLHRVKYCGNWDVLRPAKTVEGMGLISENLLEKLNNEAHSMIEKMGCAV